MTFLSPVERAYLDGTREFTKAQQRYIRCTLRKKLRLMDEDIARCDTVAAALQPGCNGSHNLLPLEVADLTERGFMSDDYDNDNVSRSPRWDLNPRPKVFALHSPSFFSSPTSILSESAGLRNLRQVKNARVGSVIPRSELNITEFCNWLALQNKKRWTIKQIKNYAVRFGYIILQSGDAADLLTLSPRNRGHAMNALASLAKYLGKYDEWLKIRQRYNLKWSSGNDYLQSFNRFFDNDLNLEVMIQRIREMIARLPDNMGRIIKFACLVGLRPAESIESVKLINDKESFAKYYNPDMMALEHFRFPHIFFRQTKKAYVSLIDFDILNIVKGIQKIPSHNAIRLACRRKGISMEMHLCRKIFGSWLRQSGGIESETVDMLSGRIPRTVFAKHYFTPSLDYREKVLTSLKKLRQEIER